MNRESAKLRACGLVVVGVPQQPPESLCRSRLLAVTGSAGPEAKELAEFFLSNNTRGLVRQLPAFWSARVAVDKSFTANHARQSVAIQNSLRDIAKQATGSLKVIDINRLAFGTDGAAQPAPLRGFPNDIDFSFQRDRVRLLKQDPLAFGIGSIQGLTVSIVEFQGSSDGKYQGKLKYELLDHYGSNDSDVIDPGQAGLWTLQRKMAKDQSSGGFEPYRPKIDVIVSFSGLVT